MAINKNHEFEELNGIKCAIVERNASAERVEFLRSLLELNKFTVEIAATPPPKPATAPPKPAVPVTDSASDTVTVNISPELPQEPAAPPPPSTFTIGVTDVTFNPINAIFGRLLKTREGNTVTLAYWQQKDQVSRDDVPYYETRK